MKLSIALVFVTWCVVVNSETLKTHLDIRRQPQDGRVELDPQTEKKTATTLSCTSTSGSASFTWARVSGGPEKKEEEREVTNEVFPGVSVSGNNLTIEFESLKNGDMYRCKLDNQRFADFKIINTDEFHGRKFGLEKFQRSMSVLFGEDLKLTCKVLNRTEEGFDFSEVAIRWYMWNTVDDMAFEKVHPNCSADGMDKNWQEITEDLQGPDESEEPHIKLLTKDGLPKAILKIEDAVRSDRRGYKCVAYNITEGADAMDCSETVTFVRVKDKYAALWPFLGIMAEVVVISLIILYYERFHKNKDAILDDDDDDDEVENSPEDANGNSHVNNENDKQSMRRRK